MAVRPVRQFLQQARTLTGDSLKKFFEDGCPYWAMALAYTSLLSLIPIVVLSFSVFSAFPESTASLEQVRRILLSHFIVSSGDVIYRHIQTFSENAGTLSVFGLLFLIVMAYSLLRTLDHALTRVWGYARNRSSFKEFVTFWTVLTLAPFLMAGSIYLSSWFRSVAGIPAMIVWSEIILPILLTWSAFFCLYRFVPKADVAWRGALTGAIVAGSLWEGAKLGFEAYVRHFSTFDQVYGSLGVIPVFLVWLYLTWGFILFGAELACRADQPAPNRETIPPEIENHRWRYALQAMLHIARGFDRGEPPLRLQDLADRLKLTRNDMFPILERLAAARLLVLSGERDQAYLLAKAPDIIQAEDVIAAAGDFTLVVPDPAEDPMNSGLMRLIQNANRANQAVWTGVSLDTLLRESGDPALSAPRKEPDTPETGGNSAAE